MLIAYVCLFAHTSEHSSVAALPKSLTQVKVTVFSPEAHRLLRQEKNVTPLLMNKSHIRSMSKKNEKRLYLTVHRLTQPGCQLSHWAKGGEKCLLLPFSLKKNHPIWKLARRRFLALVALPVTGVGELGGKARRKDARAHLHTHTSTQIQNTQNRHV